MPKTLSLIEKKELAYSINCSKVKKAPKEMPKNNRRENNIIGPFLTMKLWLAVTQTPELSKISVLIKGTLEKSKNSKLDGGQENPKSMEGEKKKWK